MKPKLFAVLAAGAMTLLGATGAGAAEAAAASEVEEYTLPNHPDSLQLHELALKEVVVQTRLKDTDGKLLGKVPFQDALNEWTRGAVKAVGYQITGHAADPKLIVFAECAGWRCETFAWLIRDVYIRKVDGQQQYFVRSPGLAVGEWSNVYVAKASGAADVAKGLEEAAYGSVRGALLEFSKAVAEAQKPEVRAREKRLFVSPLPRRAGG